MLLSQAAIDGVTCVLTVKDHQDAHLPVPSFSVCVYMAVAVGTCVCVCVRARPQASTHICAQVSSSGTPSGSSDTCSILALELTLRLSRKATPGILLSLLPSDYRHRAWCPQFFWVLEIKVGFLCMQGKNFSDWTIIPQPRCQCLLDNLRESSSFSGRWLFQKNGKI